MELTQGQYELIEPHLPVLNAILYVAEHGCKWRGLPGKHHKSGG